MSIVIIFQLLAILLSSTQNGPSNTETFRITKSYLDGQNLSIFDIQRGGILILDIANNKISNFKNYSEINKSQSYGIAETYKGDTAYIKGTPYRVMNASFEWHFKNDYDSLSGIALIVLSQIETIYGTDFSLKMEVLNSGELIEYSGYKEGTRNCYILNETLHK